MFCTLLRPYVKAHTHTFELRRQHTHLLLSQTSLTHVHTRTNIHIHTHIGKRACTHTKRCYSFILSPFSCRKKKKTKKREIWGRTVHSEWQHCLSCPLLCHSRERLHSFSSHTLRARSLNTTLTDTIRLWQNQGVDSCFKLMSNTFTLFLSHSLTLTHFVVLQIPTQGPKN